VGNPELAFQGRQTGQSRTLADWAGTARDRIARARARVAIMLRQAGNDMGTSLPLLSEVPVLGTSRNVRDGGVTRIIAEIHNGADRLTVIEEAAEGIAKWLLDGHVSWQEMTRWLRQTEQQTRTRFLADDLGSMDPAARLQEFAEAFSWVARNNAVGKIQDSALYIATDFARLRREGKVDVDFTHWLDVAAGLDAEYQNNGIVTTPDEVSLAEASRSAGGEDLHTFSIPPLESDSSGKSEWDTPEKLQAYKQSLAA